MTSISLFINSFTLLWRYKKTAFFLITLSSLLTFLPQLLTRGFLTPILFWGGKIPGYFLGSLAVYLLFYLFVGAAIAVAWHRRVLIGEELNLSTSAIFGKPVWSYILGLLLIFAIALIVMTIGTQVLRFFAYIVDGTRSTAASVFFGILSIVTILAIVVVMIRISVLLPARAVGKKINVEDAFIATSSANWIVLGYALLMAGVAFILSAPATYGMMSMIGLQGSGLLNFGLISIGTAILTMTQVSAMTLLYAEYLKDEPHTP